MEWGWARTAALTWVAALLLVAPAQASHAGSLAGQWHLDTTSSGTVSLRDVATPLTTPDSSGHGLTLGGDSSTPNDPGRFGKAFNFLGPNTVWRTSSTGLGELEPETVTLIAWVKSAAPGPGTTRYVAGKGGNGCQGASYALYTAESGGLRFYTWDGVHDASRSPDAGTGVWDNNWHMLAGTFDGATVRLYVDGNQIGDGTTAVGPIAYALGDRRFSLGGYTAAGSCGFATDFEGFVDEPRIYNRALSAAEIGRMAADTGTSPPTLIPDVPEPGAGGAGGGAGSLPLIIPRFVAAKPVKVKRALWFNALSSDIPSGVRVKRYDWDFNGDGQYEAGCGPEAPAVTSTFRKAGTYSVVLKVTDVFDRTTTVKQQVAVTKAQVNLVRRTFFDCERPLGANQPDRKDCVKTFSFGIIEVNARGDSDQCFTITSRIDASLLNRQGARASGIAKQLDYFRVYHAKVAGPVALNGIPVPIPKDRTTEYDSGEQTIALGPDIPIYLPLPGGKLTKVVDVPLNQKITPTGTPKRFKLPPLKAPKIAKFGGLSLGGGLEISLLNRASEFKLSLKLPDVFSFGFKREAEGSVIVRATNLDGLQFEGARISHIPQVFLGPLLVNDLFFEYRKTGEVWSGGANFQFPGISPVQIKAAPPPPDYGFGLKGGKFEHAGGGIAFPIPPRPQLFPGVSLQEIGGAIGIKPYRFTGRLAIAAAEIAAIDGSAFIALASQDQPYDFPEEFAPPGLDFLAGRHLDTVSIAVGGQSQLQVPVLGQIPLINSYLFYAYPDYVEFGGGFKFEKNFDDQKFSVEGGVGGFASIGRRLFNLEGKVQGCLDVDVIGKVCKGVDAVISSKGIGFCTVVPIPVSPFGPVIPVDAGLGFKWGDSTPDIMIFSCDAGPYREARPASARAAQAGARSFTLPAGLPSAMVKVTGAEGPPSVVLTGPKGERIVAPQTEAGAVSQNAAVLRLAQAKTTLIALKAPSAGRWTITPQPGSTVTSVATRVGLAAPSIKARVSGRGQRRVLTYDVRQDAGQTVSFVERGARTWRPIGNATAAHGRIAFTPADGSAGKRRIVALVQRDGVVKQTIEVARYAAPGMARPAKPRRLRVARRRGSALVASWARARGAFQYSVTVQLGNGRRLLRLTKRRRLVITGIDPRTRATVRVAGLRADSVHGAEAVKALRARRR
jgi:hypothetical protein